MQDCHAGVVTVRDGALRRHEHQYNGFGFCEVRQSVFHAVDVFEREVLNLRGPVCGQESRYSDNKREQAAEYEWFHGFPNI
jgi:hypothetical protein